MKDVVAALIFDEAHRFLICRRPPHKMRGMLWEFVGGKAEAGETLSDALIRECREELDITVDVGEEFLQLIHEYPDLTIRLTVFLCKIAEGTPKLLEHVGMKWITPGEIPEYEFCPADREVLEKIVSVFGA